MGLGDFVNQFLTWVNGGSPAIDADNLQRFDNKLLEVDNELRKSQCFNFKDWKDYYWERNTKELDNFTDYAEYTAGGSTSLSNDTTNNVIGYNAVRFTETDNVASWIGMYQTLGAAIDLSIFNDGSASATSDLIYLLVYISDITKFTLVQFKLGTDNANNYSISWASGSLTTGWNVLIAQKSDFTPNGGVPGWNNITYYRVEATTTINAQNSYITCQYWQMVREDPDWSSYMNAFQEYMGSVTGWQNKLEYWSDWYSIIYDERIRRFGIMQLNPSNIQDGLAVYFDILSFLGKFEFYCKLAGYTQGICWYVDANNYAETYISTSKLYLNVVEGGASTSQNVAFTNSLALNEKVIITFEKDNDTIRTIAYKAGEQQKSLVHETTISGDSEGTVFLNTVGTSSFGICTDFAISSNYGDIHIENEISKANRIYLVNTDVDYVNNTLTSVSDLLIRLLPNKIYKIELTAFIRNSGSAIPDAKIAWTYSTDITLISSIRGSAGAPSTTNTSEPSASMRTSAHGFATAVRYALVASTTSSLIKEYLIIKTTRTGGYIQPQMAQYNTDAANATSLRAGSYIIVSEVFE